MSKFGEYFFWFYIVTGLSGIILFVGSQVYKEHAEYVCRNQDAIANVGVFEYRCIKVSP